MIGAALEMTARESVSTFKAEYPFDPHFLALDGATMHYVDEGPRDASPVLCVHGNPTWSFFFRGLVRQLSDRYRVVAPDHVGCGLSSKPANYPYRLARHIENLERLVRAKDLRDITLVVHDWGGAIGMGMAVRNPERVARLVILNTAAFRSKRIPLRIAACRIPVFGSLAIRGLNGFARAATRMAVRRPLTDGARRGYLRPYDSWNNRVATWAFVQDIPMRPGHPSYDTLVEVEEGLSRLADRPAALVWGERDWCFTPAFRAEWQERLPNAEVQTFEDAGHYVLEDAGPEACAWIDRFLARTTT